MGLLCSNAKALVWSPSAQSVSKYSARLEIQGWNAQVELNRLQSKHSCKEIRTKSPRDHRPTGGSVLSRLAYSETASRSISRKGTSKSALRLAGPVSSAQALPALPVTARPLLAMQSLLPTSGRSAPHTQMSPRNVQPPEKLISFFLPQLLC